MNKKIKISIATLLSVLLTKGNTVRLESLLKSSLETYTTADMDMMFNFGNLMKTVSNSAGSITGAVTGNEDLKNTISTTG